MNKQTIIETIKTAALTADPKSRVFPDRYKGRDNDNGWTVSTFGCSCPLGLEIKRGGKEVVATHLSGGGSGATLTTEAEVRGYIIAWVEAVQERYNRSKAA